MVTPFNNLDSMEWTIGISAIIIAILLIKMKYDSTTDTFEDNGIKDRIGYVLTLGGGGLYLLISGLYISFAWPYTTGLNNVLFGGIATLGGLLLTIAALALYFNGGFRIVSYFGAGVAAYALTGAYAILVQEYTKTPLVSALGYIGMAAAAIFIIPVTHSNNKILRYIAAIFAILFAAVWLFMAVTTTSSHLGNALF